ncbi:MAG: flagellar motor switch protein FliN [Bdellovibrionaceae bacterium]|nr:flagellar motor switch protein FliN [Pseudobdellovibrionaceae bacterium]
MSEKNKVIAKEELDKVRVLASVEVGRRKISVGELADLSKGSVLELDRLAGEPLDLFIGETLFAKGEVVVINEKFGIRITDIIKGG